MIKNDLKTLMNVARARRGLSLRKMAEQIGYQPGHISNIENGKTTVPANYFSKLCNILQLEEIEKIEIFTAIASMQNGYLEDAMTEEEKSILAKIYEFFQKIRNANPDILMLPNSDTLNQMIQVIKEMLKSMAGMQGFKFS